ncbi:unnamed protein product [Mucor fragilis]
MHRNHLESWYQSHIWSMVENAIDTVNDIDAVTGESVSHASRKRKNANRHISSLDIMDNMQYGHRLDMIFQQCTASHSEALEFGGSEAGIKDINDSGTTKYLHERMYRLPRALKDMLDGLYEVVLMTDQLQYKLLRTVGFIHSGPNSQMIILDRLTLYVSRVNAYKAISIGPHISRFSSVLPAIYSAWACRQIIAEVLHVVKASDKTSLDLDTCLLNPPPFPKPATSISRRLPN